MANRESYTNMAFMPDSRQRTYGRREYAETTYEQPPRLPPSRNPASPNIYEEAPGKNDRQREDSKTKRMTSRTSILIAILFGLMLVALLAETSLLLSYGYNSEVETISVCPTVCPQETDPPEIASPKARSCLDLREKGSTSSGIYKIFSEDYTWEYEVFCDMETDGGGWTLVASVHEDDIERKCDSEDRWSTYDMRDACYQAKTAWENKLTFGSVSTCTSTDYKNQAYASLKAENVMIWHVPNATPIEAMKDKAKLRYRSTNDFLSQFEGNFHSLYGKFYELSSRQNYALDESYMKQRAKMVAEALGKSGQTIKSHVPNWHDYATNIQSYYIEDSALYDPVGNVVHFILSGTSRLIRLLYDEEYTWGLHDFSATIARTGTPFLMVSVIGNADQKYGYPFFITMVESHRPKEMNSSEIGGEVVMKNFTLQYLTVQFVGDVHSTLCQFHFVVFNEKEWRSTRPSDFRKYSGDGGGGYAFSADGGPINIVMGYILLTRDQGLEVTKDMLDNVARTTLSTIADVPYLFNEYGGSDGLVVPVTFDEGDENVVLETVPKLLRRRVEPGYLQLRAYSLTGYPNALCPGLKMKSYSSEYVCIGGLSNNTEDTGTCGDYAGWKGKKNPWSGEIDTDYAHSNEDLKTTILIFYR